MTNYTAAMGTAPPLFIDNVDTSRYRYHFTYLTILGDCLASNNETSNMVRVK